MNKTYPSDLTNNQWNHIKELFETEKQRGRPTEIDLRLVVNAILFILVSGCQWRYLPKEYPNWQSVYYHKREVEKEWEMESDLRGCVCRISRKRRAAQARDSRSNRFAKRQNDSRAK